MDFKTLNSVYFIGIGGIGMSALARYFLDKGFSVAGYDKTQTPLTKNLEQSGIDVIYDDIPDNLPDSVDLVVYTPAIKDELNIIKALRSFNIPFVKRAEALGFITNETPLIAIAGTHGKTTVCSMIIHIMKTAGIEINGFAGGITKNYSSNFIGSPNPKWMVVEADEFDRSFLNLNPFYSIITSIDADHLDIYKNKDSVEDAFHKFIQNTDRKGHLVLKAGVTKTEYLLSDYTTYSFEKSGDIFAENVSVNGLVNHYDIAGKINIKGIKLKVPGFHNIENSLAAVAVAKLIDIDNETIIEALNTYEGVQRRFDIKINNNRIVYIDDYAHHPVELRAFITSVRNLLPGKRITGIFQPHLFSRTQDFAKEFAESLQLLDMLILLDIYPAREKPIEGVSSKLIFDIVNISDKYLLKKEQVIDFLKEADIDVLLTMGAGDIDRLVEPITQNFEKQKII